MDSIVTTPITPTEIDRMESVMMQELCPVDLPLVHRFTPGLYIREIHIPAGVWASTMVHKTEHPFVVTQGIVQVYDESSGEEVIIEAPYTGITKPGTRRVLYAHTDTVWTTFHVNPDDERDTEKIGERIVQHYPNPLIDNNDPKANVWRGHRPELKAGES